MGLLDNIEHKPKASSLETLFIYSYPKVGKTTLLTNLPGSYLIIDFEGGTKYLHFKGIDVPNYNTYIELVNEFKAKTGKIHFNFICLDTITSMTKNIASIIAVQLYNTDNPKAPLPLETSVISIPYGKGNHYLSMAILKIIQFFKKYCDTVIITGHVLDKSYGSSGIKAEAKDIEIEGDKTKNTLLGNVDGIGFLYKHDDYKNYIMFSNSDSSVLGSRIKRLNKANFLISEIDENTGEIKTYWEKIFDEYAPKEKQQSGKQLTTITTKQ